jgi:hypothetical protein
VTEAQAWCFRRHELPSLVRASARRPTIGASGLDASKAAETDIKDTTESAMRTVLLYTVMGALLAALMSWC